MEWFILSRDMHVLCAPSTDSPNSLPIFDDKQTILLSNNTVVSTYDFSVQQKHPDAQYLQMGNYIVFVDKYHKTKMYTLMSHDGDDLTHTWHAEDVGLDLLNESSEKWDYTGQPRDIAWYLNNLVLKDSGWTIGINEVSTLTRALKFDGETDTQLRRLGDIANQFDGAEVDFTIEMNGAQVTKQVVNIYKKVGSSVTQGRYIDSVNLKSLHSSGSIADLVTALKPFGTQMDMPEGQEGEAPRITIADVAYDDGRYYSPKGHPYLYDREARQQWSRFKAYNYANQGEFDGYIVGSYSYDTKDPNELLNRALTELKSRNKPSETYEANLLDINADIGDYVQIAHNQYNPPIYLSARVESVTNCYTANGQDTGVLGDYRKLESDIDPRIKEMLNALENQIKSHYMWIRYAEDDKGKGMTSVPTVGTKYIAILVNKPTAIPSDKPADYAGHWQLIKGSDGKNGIPGATGADGKTSYTHFAYADNVSGTKDFSTDDPTGRSYMGVYSDFTKADSNNPSDYVWSYTKGETGPEGTQGIPGKPGADGKTPYFHTAWADSKDGKINFSLNDATNRGYLGTYTDFTQADSTDPAKYTWTELVGNLKIGGTNLAKGTSSDWKKITTSGWGISNLSPMITNIANGKEYVISVEVRNVTQPIMLENWMCDANGSRATTTAQTVYSPISNQVTTLSAVFTANVVAPNVAFHPNLAFQRYLGTTVGSYEYRCVKFERGNKATDWSPAPEDTQGQIDTINSGLANVNSKIAAVTKVDAQATAPTNPKNGDQWWVKDANGEINAFKIWDGTQWAPSTITQSLLVIKELDAVNINGSVINGSKFTNNFDFTDLNKINFKGVTEIANGSYKTDFKIAGSNQVGHVYVQPDGLHTYVSGRNGDVSTRQSIDLAFDAISLANGSTFGTLTAADIESTEREVWITSDGVNKPEVGFHKQFRQVWLDGLIALNAASAANPQFLFKLKNSKLYPKASRYISLISLRDIPNTAILRIDPDGSISNISCPVSNMRFVSEGIFYTIGD